MNLERFRIAKAPEIARLRAQPPPPPCGSPRPPFLAPRAEGGGIRIIAEYKRASPSRGAICDNYSPEEIAGIYTGGGAAAISVLTEGPHFRGEIDFLRRVASRTTLPLLRKDFIFDEAQVRETASTPASALLLIVALTPGGGLLRDLRVLTESFGMTAVVEIFDEHELDIAREAGASVIQVNNRNLETLVVDASVTQRLVARKLGGERWIAASGYETRAQIDALAGYDAALVGTALMASPDPGGLLKQLATGNEKLETGN
ncbi:MAG: indole-3-glycerol-phosphate synthase [Kiritimatiellaeota bacterium]|nr:indole-3-glycerol-phosphate synthase [Kiritimatiellota bacterium]